MLNLINFELDGAILYKSGEQWQSSCGELGVSHTIIIIPPTPFNTTPTTTTHTKTSTIIIMIIFLSHQVMDLLALTNCTVNFVLYCLMSRQFRITFRKTFHLGQATCQGTRWDRQH